MRLIFRLLALLICALQGWASYASEIHPAQLKIIPASRIYTAFCDREGYMWIGSNLGLTRYDGTTATSIAADHPSGIVRILQDGTGRIWCVDDNHDLFYIRNDRRVLIRSGAKDWIRGLVSFQGKVYLTTNNGVHIFDSKTLRSHFFKFNVGIGIGANIFQLRDKLFIYQFTTSTIYTFDGKHLIKIKPFRTGKYRTLFFQNQANRVFATSHPNPFEEAPQTIYELDYDGKELVVKNSIDWRGSTLTNIISFGHDHYWINAKTESRSDANEVYHGYETIAVVQDKEGNDWFVSRNGLHVRYRHLPVTPVSQVRTNIYSVEKGQSCLYLGALGKLLKYDISAAKVTDSTDLPGWNFEVGFVRHVIGHEFVVQSNVMTYFYNDETKKLRKLGGATFLNSVAIFGSMVYMASDQLSYFYDLIHPESKSDKLVPKNLIHKYCWNCLESILDVSVMPGKNKIVFATDSNVFEYTPGYQRPLKFNDQNIVASALLHDNGKLYIASVKLGLLIYQSEKVRRVISKGELGPEKILGFRKIGDKIWLLNSGVPKIFDPAKERLDRNAMTDDYSVTDVLQFGKMVYFLSSNGLYTVNINSDPDTTSFNCKNTFTLINGRDTVYDDQIKASHDKNDFQFNLSSAVFRSAADTRYKYRLNSATQGEWNITSGQSGLIRFASLKPGEYVFEAMAINPARGTSQNIVHASFIILPPWWDTWIFKSITLLILLALIFLSVRIYYRIQINRQRVYFENKLNIEKEQQRISREIHDDIGQSLSVIKMNLAIGDPEQLREARTIISDVIKDLRNLTHTLYYGSTLQNDLITSIKMSIKRLNAAKQLKADLCISGKQNFLSDELELAIYRVFQEAVNNTLKHADALTIRVTISFQEKDFVMIIEDDGKGFDISSAAEGIGMASIRKRAETIGGIIEISSLPGSGTKITLKIHL